MTLKLHPGFFKNQRNEVQPTRARGSLEDGEKDINIYNFYLLDKYF